MMKSFLC